jgi:calcineurin-like phosphoesterase family protein
VRDSDTVYYLGDLTFGRLTEKDRLKASALSKNQQQLERMNRYKDSLNGKIVWVKGNHLDPKGAVLSARKEVDGIEFDMIHNPARSNEIRFWKTNTRWLIHGHTHNKHPDLFPFIDPEKHWVNACVEVIDYRPLSLNRLAELCKQGNRLLTLTL